MFEFSNINLAVNLILKHCEVYNHNIGKLMLQNNKMLLEKYKMSDIFEDKVRNKVKANICVSNSIYIHG